MWPGPSTTGQAGPRGLHRPRIPGLWGGARALAPRRPVAGAVEPQPRERAARWACGPDGARGGAQAPASTPEAPTGCPADNQPPPNRATETEEQVGVAHSAPRPGKCQGWVREGSFSNFLTLLWGGWSLKY